MQAEAPAQPPVPTDPRDIDRIGLGWVDGDVERDALVLVDARRRRKSFDLLVQVVRERPRPHPGIGTGLLILQDNRIVGGLRHDRPASTRHDRYQRECEHTAAQTTLGPGLRLRAFEFT